MPRLDDPIYGLSGMLPSDVGYVPSTRLLSKVNAPTFPIQHMEFILSYSSAPETISVQVSPMADSDPSSIFQWSILFQSVIFRQTRSHIAEADSLGQGGQSAAGPTTVLSRFTQAGILTHMLCGIAQPPHAKSKKMQAH